MNLSKDEKKVLSIWIAVSLIVILILFLFSKISINKLNKKNEEAMDNIVYNETNYLNNKDVYYTVKSSINKFYSFLNMNDKDSILKILDSNYISNNNINKNNVLDKFNTNVEFNTYSKMCVLSVKSSTISFVIKGLENKINETETKDVYYKVILNYDNSVFSISPTDEKSYIGGCDE